MQAPPVRAGDVLCALSLATDLGTGQPLEHALATTALAVELAHATGAGAELVHDVRCLALLHAVGCTADAFEAARHYGDDIAVRAAYATVDGGRPVEVLGFLARHAGSGSPPLRRAAAFAGALAAGPSRPRAGFASHCEVGQRLAERLSVSSGVHRALGFVFERFDGKGYPDGAAGEAIPPAARLLHVARDAVVFGRLHGSNAACALIAQRAGTAYDPAVAAVLEASLLAAADDAEWEGLLARDAALCAPLDDSALDAACAAIADFADLKSPACLGHAHAVAELAEAAAWRVGMPAPEVRVVRRAALVADLGRVAVSNAIWDKPGPLREAERERVRMHPYFTERALACAPGLEALGEIAAAHHERVGGSGYHRGVDAARLPLGARIVAAADVYAALTEERPQRPALTGGQAAGELQRADLDPEAVAAVLAAAGHVAPRVERPLPAGLSAREVEVLALLARGGSNKQIAAALGISPKTAGHHVGNVYAKIGVSTRAAAALFAVENDLLRR